MSIQLQNPIGNNPAGPKERSMLGSLTAFRRNPTGMLIDYWQRYGDLYRMRLGPYPVYVVTHPDHAQHVLVDNHSNYSRGKFFKNFERIIGKGLVSIEGEEWKKHRRTMQPSFQRNYVTNYAEAAIQGALRMLETWDLNAGDDRPFDAAFDLFQLVLTTFGQSLYSTDLSPYADDFIPYAHEGSLQLIQNVLLPEWVPTPKNLQLKEVRRLFDRMVAGVIGEHQGANSGARDVVSALLEQQSNGSLTLEQVHYELLTLLFVGTDTTTAALSWAMYILSVYPEVQQRMYEEARDVLNGRTPTIDDLPELAYTKRVIQEVLRLYPPVWILTRDPIEDDMIGGCKIPAGSTVMVNPYLVHRHPAFWGNPEAFNPDRFLEPQMKEQHRCAFIPFGAGQHQCIGMHSAMQQMHLTLPMIVQRFRVHMEPSGTVTPSPSLTLHPNHGLRVRLQRRG